MNHAPSSYWFLGLLALVALARVAELIYAKALGQKAKSRGETPQKERNFVAMVALHSLFFIGITIETWALATPAPIWLVAVCTLTLALAFGLRLWTLKSLSGSWHVRILKPATIVTHGPYAFIRHPNYLVVILEILALPLLGGCYLSAFVFTLWNAAVLAARIPQEEAMLFQVTGYEQAFKNKGRFLPRRLRKS
jgi:methyltransferase